MKSTTLDVKKHKCKYFYSYSRGIDKIGFRCAVCKLFMERDTSQAEKSDLREHQHVMKVESTRIHKVFHSYIKNIRDKGFKGYDASVAMTKWAKRQPKGHVHLVSCDDSSHMGSDLWLIEHKTESTYMGTTVIYLPQDLNSREFFLYPYNVAQLNRVLTKIEKAAAPIRRAQIKHEAAWRLLTSKWKLE